MDFDQELLNILACPECKGALELLQDESGLVCPACQRLYPIKDGVPIMLIEESKPYTKSLA